MSTQWNQTTEHVCYNEDIAQVLREHYPHVHKQLHEILESTIAYLGAVVQSKFRALFVQSVQRQLEQFLQASPTLHVGETIAQKCMETLPATSIIPKGEHCSMIGSVKNITDRVHMICV